MAANDSARCSHCDRRMSTNEVEDSRDAGASRRLLCAECLDIAVWGGRCADCEREPGRGPCDAARYAAMLAGRA
jgi:hypothetical protein